MFYLSHNHDVEVSRDFVGGIYSSSILELELDLELILQTLLFQVS